MPLNFNLKFEDLYNTKALAKLDAKFLNYLSVRNHHAYNFLLAERKIYQEFSPTYSNDALLISAGKIVEEFLIELFALKSSYVKIQPTTDLARFHQEFVNKYVKTFAIQELQNYNFYQIEEQVLQLLQLSKFESEPIINAVLLALNNPKQHQDLLQKVTILGAFMMFEPSISLLYPAQVLFIKVKKTDFQKLIPYQQNGNSFTKALTDNFINRNDFNFYNPINNLQAQHQSNYCVKCHVRHKDHCRHGHLEADNTYTKNPLEQALTGCPLSMNISEMHLLHSEKHLLGALAVMMINNPLLAGTGDNICTDCKTACIFQKQSTVDTPKVESYILQQVLSLPWGFEIYSLLTRWNPLRHYRPFPKTDTNYKVLIVGLGPAGYTLAYNLALEGHDVVALDSFKIEAITKFKQLTPIINIQDIWEDLDSRIVYGFGGVAEYGITSRWDKNYLSVIRIILERQTKIAIMGNIRFGSMINFQNAKALGFNHLALCTGAGKPKILNYKNSMIKGIKTASEFLMNLHLGAFQLHSLLNLQIQLPLVIIGGGLTAVDCATEALVYYQRLVEKIYHSYQQLKTLNRLESFTNKLTLAEKQLLATYLKHYEIIKLAKQKMELIPTLQALGGVKIIYHNAFNKSSAYKANFQDLQQCLKQGVEFIEHTKLVKINLNSQQDLESITLENTLNQSQSILAIKNLIFALGTSPNDVVIQESNQQTTPLISTLPEYNQIYKQQKFSSYLSANSLIDTTIMGDSHYLFNGSVVKAMASSYYAQYTINKLLAKQSPALISFVNFKKNLEARLQFNISQIKFINPKLVEMTIKHKLLAQAYQAGQFFKIQTKKQNSFLSELSEAVFVTGVVFDSPALSNQLKIFLQITGSSSNIVAHNHQALVINGPLGEPTSQHQNKAILLIAGGVANGVTLGILEQMHKDNAIYYLAGFRTQADIFYSEQIKQHTINSIISVEELEENQNSSYLKGNIIDALNAFILAQPTLSIDEIIIAGSCGMMSVVKKFLSNHDYFKNSKVTASLNSMMQCGLKGICATCLQKVGNQFIYACAKQEQSAYQISFSFLENKLKQNSLQEKLSYTLKNSENS